MRRLLIGVLFLALAIGLAAVLDSLYKTGSFTERVTSSYSDLADFVGSNIEAILGRKVEATTKLPSNPWDMLSEKERQELLAKVGPEGAPLLKELLTKARPEVVGLLISREMERAIAKGQQSSRLESEEREALTALAEQVEMRRIEASAKRRDASSPFGLRAGMTEKEVARLLPADTPLDKGPGRYGPVWFIGTVPYPSAAFLGYRLEFSSVLGLIKLTAYGRVIETNGAGSFNKEVEDEYLKVRRMLTKEYGSSSVEIDNSKEARMMDDLDSSYGSRYHSRENDISRLGAIWSVEGDGGKIVSLPTGIDRMSIETHLIDNLSDRVVLNIEFKHYNDLLRVSGF